MAETDLHLMKRATRHSRQ